MSIPGLDAGGITPELKPKTEILLVLNLVDFFFRFDLFSLPLFFVLLLWVFNFYFYFHFSFVLSTSPSLSSHPYSHPLHPPSFS
jgi:hypothetical protein